MSLNRIEDYLQEIEKIEGPQPAFRAWLEYTDYLVSIMSPRGGHIVSRQIVALAYATYKLIRHDKNKP